MHADGIPGSQIFVQPKRLVEQSLPALTVGLSPPAAIRAGGFRGALACCPAYENPPIAAPPDYDGRGRSESARSNRSAEDLSRQ